MFFLTGLISLALVQIAACRPHMPYYLRSAYTSPCNISSARVQRELGASLSSGATIYGQQDAGYANSTHRWGTFAVPTVQVAINVGAEDDVAKIIQYCNQNSIEFLTYTSGHGTPSSLASFNGIQIGMANLRSVTIQPDGQSAWFQGGCTAGHVNKELWDLGYVTPTGACDCVGLAGAGIGGGHGPLQGLYGFVSDNMRQVNVVLANGTAVTANATNHPDLFWGMRGAGHNFAVVTSMELGIFPRGPLSWFYKNYIYSGDKLAQIFTALNELHGNHTTPVNMTKDNGFFLMVPEISTTAPVISWNFIYRGSEEESAPYFAPFDAIGPISFESGNVPYSEIGKISNSDYDSITCAGSVDRILTTASLFSWNITIEQQIYDSFVDRITSNPELTNHSLIIHEGQSTEAVIQVDPNSSAVPWRERQFLTQFQGIISDPSLTSEMTVWANQVRDLWNSGQPDVPTAAYVNYASGFEPKEEWYGDEPWRLEKLRQLKADYDPFNRFRYYCPIVQDSSNSTR